MYSKCVKQLDSHTLSFPNKKNKKKLSEKIIINISPL